MLRKLVIISAFVGTAASVPIVYQQNPEALQNLVRAAVEYDSSAPSAEETASVKRMPHGGRRSRTTSPGARSGSQPTTGATSPATSS